MFFKKELDATKRLCELKIQEVLNDTDKRTDVEYIRDLQVLILMKDAAEKQEGF